MESKGASDFMTGLWFQKVAFESHCTFFKIWINCLDQKKSSVTLYLTRGIWKIKNIGDKMNLLNYLSDIACSWELRSIWDKMILFTDWKILKLPVRFNIDVSWDSLG